MIYQERQGEFYVALRKESVDRNDSSGVDFAEDWVALRKESVDRNINCDSNFTQKKHPVALRKESVDRNFDVRYTASTRPSRSPQGERG